MKRVRWRRLLFLTLVVVGLIILIGSVSLRNTRQFITAIFNFPTAQAQLQRRDEHAGQIELRLQEFRNQREIIDEKVVDSKNVASLLTDIQSLDEMNQSIIKDLELLLVFDQQLTDLTAGQTAEVVFLLQRIDEGTMSVQRTWHELYKRKSLVFNLHLVYYRAVDCSNDVNFKARDSQIVSALDKCLKLSREANQQFILVQQQFPNATTGLTTFMPVWLESQEVLLESYKLVARGKTKEASQKAKDAKKLRSQAAGFNIAELLTQYEEQLTADLVMQINELNAELEKYRGDLSGLKNNRWLAL